MEKYSMAIQVFSDQMQGNLVFSQEERNEIKEALADQFNIHWIPPIITPRRGDVAAASDSSVILIFVLGLAFSSLAKPFLEEIGKQAGKSFWKAVTTLVSKLWKKEVDGTYRLTSRTYLIFELDEDFVGIDLRLPRTDKESMKTSEKYEKLIQSQLSDLSQSWEQVMADIRKFRLGQTKARERQYFHIISRHDNKWIIMGKDLRELFQSAQRYI